MGQALPEASAPEAVLAAPTYEGAPEPVLARVTVADGQRLDDLADSLNRDRAELARSILLDGLATLEADVG